MKNYITTIPDSNEVTTDKALLLLKIYFYLRLACMFILIIIGIIICVELNNVTDELQHYIFHMTDGACCNLYR